MAIEWERWSSLDDAEARTWVDRIAGQVGAASTELRRHEYAGRGNRIALLDIEGVKFALVPGGRVRLGYDGARFVPTPEQLASYQCSAQDLGITGSIHEHVDEFTSPPRTADVPALLVAVEAVEAGLTEVPVDEPIIVRSLEELHRIMAMTGAPMPRQAEFGGLGRILLDPDGSVRAAWMYDTPSLEQEAARLAAQGRRLLTPNEWEHACGAGATTLFRWGDTYPEGTDPYSASAGPHREPNLFGLLIGQDPYRDERTADPGVICGGDGGGMVCGGSGEFVSWLTIATAYRNAEYAEFVQGEAEDLDQLLVREAIPLDDGSSGL